MAEFPNFSDLPIEVQKKLFMSNPARQYDGITAEEFERKVREQEELKEAEENSYRIHVMKLFCEATDPSHPPAGLALHPRAVATIHELLHELAKTWKQDPDHWFTRTLRQADEEGL